MNRNRPCDECAWCNGEHAEWCVSRGYSAVGPHPDAPVSETVRAPGVNDNLEQCPCGRPRAGCDYHDPALQPAAPDREYEVYDLAHIKGMQRDFVASLVAQNVQFRWGCGCLRRKGQSTHMHGFTGWLLSAEDVALLDGE